MYSCILYNVIDNEIEPLRRTMQVYIYRKV